ncbi:MAG: transporter associated domain-containing protein, partial [Pseudomonadota bacterium]
GEIQDEHDVEEELFVPLADGTVLVSAVTPLWDFEEHFGVAIPREGFDSLGGFIIHLLGRVPTVGEEIEHSGLFIRIHSGDAKKITRVMVVPSATEASGRSEEPHEDRS